MLKRQLFFFAIAAAPVAVFSVRRPALAGALALSGLVAWWAASPVTWPAWVSHGLVRALPASAIMAVALWLLSR